VVRVLQSRKRMLMKLDDMQLGFMPGKWMTDVCLCQEGWTRSIVKNGNITSFVHIEKVFDLVPREFMEWTK